MLLTHFQIFQVLRKSKMCRLCDYQEHPMIRRSDVKYWRNRYNKALKDKIKYPDKYTFYGRLIEEELYTANRQLNKIIFWELL
jgi:hypothetical protein